MPNCLPRFNIWHGGYNSEHVDAFLPSYQNLCSGGEHEYLSHRQAVEHLQARYELSPQPFRRDMIYLSWNETTTDPLLRETITNLEQAFLSVDFFLGILSQGQRGSPLSLDILECF